VVKSEGNRQLGKSRHIWENNIKMYLQKVVFVNAVMNFLVP